MPTVRQKQPREPNSADCVRPQWLARSAARLQWLSLFLPPYGPLPKPAQNGHPVLLTEDTVRAVSAPHGCRPADLLALRAQADHLLTHDGLGRSSSLERLFRYLLTCSLESRTPKELEIADQVFSRVLDNREPDASVRVYIHRLRKKLDEYYSGPGADQAVRLTIPKGGYRLAASPVGPSPEEPAPPAASPEVSAPKVQRLGLALLILLAAALGWWGGSRRDAPAARIEAVRSDPLWQPFVSASNHTTMAVGDYYIFGERDQSGDVSRLIRQFDVNSSKDLNEVIDSQKRSGVDYEDLGLSYLPVGIGSAMRTVVPILRDPQHSGVLPTSQLTPEILKSNNIVYLGYISGLGPLRDAVFKGSRFEMGDSYDEIIDQKTGRTYMAGTHLDEQRGVISQDYALISAFPGVSGSHILAIAGTRDAALMQAAEFSTSPQLLKPLDTLLKQSSAVEILLAIQTLNGVGLRAEVIAASPRRSDVVWTGKPNFQFPDTLPGDAM